jgi:hypothetical protein
MTEKITTGTILIKEGTVLPEGLQLESESYLKGWNLVKNLECSGMDRKLCEARWTFFFMAGEASATIFGSDKEKATRHAVGKILTSIKSAKLNCLEIAHVAAKRFLGLPFVSVSAHPRHIQQSMFLFHADHMSELGHAKSAA